MAVTRDVIETVRAALADQAQVEEARIEVLAEGDNVVLRGAVPTAEQASTAAIVAGAHAPSVDNRLTVDPHIREDETGVDEVGDAPPDRARPPRSEEPTIHASSGEPEVVEEDLPTDAHAAMAENVPLDPPDAPHTAPTASEQVPGPVRETEVEEAADAGDVPEDGEPSASDLSQADCVGEASAASCPARRA